MRYEEDLIDQFFNPSEKRLARVPLILSRAGEEDAPAVVVPKVSQESLAEMIGTTRSRSAFLQTGQLDNEASIDDWVMKP